MARGGGDIARISGVIAPKRPVRPVNDAFGSFDDPRQRRAQGLVERGVDRSIASGFIGGFRDRHMIRQRATAEADETAIVGPDWVAADDQARIAVSAWRRRLTGGGGA